MERLAERRRALQQALTELALRHGATAGPDLDGKVVRCVTQLEEALTATATDSESLSPLDVVRIRAGKFVASLTPPSVFRDPHRLLALRAEIHDMALLFVGGAGAEGSRFLPGQRK